MERERERREESAQKKRRNEGWTGLTEPGCVGADGQLGGCQWDDGCQMTCESTADGTQYSIFPHIYGLAAGIMYLSKCRGRPRCPRLPTRGFHQAHRAASHLDALDGVVSRADRVPIVGSWTQSGQATSCPGKLQEFPVIYGHTVLVLCNNV